MLASGGVLGSVLVLARGRAVANSRREARAVDEREPVEVKARRPELESSTVKGSAYPLLLA